MSPDFGGSFSNGKFLHLPKHYFSGGHSFVFSGVAHRKHTSGEVGTKSSSQKFSMTGWGWGPGEIPKPKTKGTNVQGN